MEYIIVSYFALTVFSSEAGSSEVAAYGCDVAGDCVYQNDETGDRYVFFSMPPYLTDYIQAYEKKTLANCISNYIAATGVSKPIDYKNRKNVQSNNATLGAQYLSQRKTDYRFEINTKSCIR